jgi:hypothetical protein
VADGDGLTERLRDLAGIPRLTPYEMAFADDGYEARIFPRLMAESDALGEDPARRDRFAFLTLAGDALRDVVPDEAPPDALEQYRSLLYHAFNFWRSGRRLYTLDLPLARYLVEGAPTLTDWSFQAPTTSVYVQLPPNLFWASISPEVQPEPVDGFFVTSSRGDDPLGPAYRKLEVLMVLGMRRERAGFSIIPFDTEVGPGIAAVWAETPGREGARDFENILPGGEMSGLYSILTTAEALKLLARALWYVDTHPADVEPCEAPERRTQDRPGSVPLSRLYYYCVRFGAGGDGEASGAPGADEPAADGAGEGAGA